MLKSNTQSATSVNGWRLRVRETLHPWYWWRTPTKGWTNRILLGAYYTFNQHRIVFTQDGYHNVISQDLDGAAGQKVERSEHITAVDQRVSGRGMGGFEAHGQGPQAAFGGSLERFAVLKEILVEVKADICLQALGKTF